MVVDPQTKLAMYFTIKKYFELCKIPYVTSIFAAEMLVIQHAHIYVNKIKQKHVLFWYSKSVVQKLNHFNLD